MKSFTYVITDEIGIHARPAGLLVKAAKAVPSKVTIKFGKKSADATKLMALMGLAVKHNDKVTVEVSGETEETDILKIRDFFNKNL